ncbi:MAG: Rad52/Rad22 family DNA repair protein [Stellaceae bacterium]
MPRCGTGHGSGATSGEAHESAPKEAETDATKRALATFGNQFGLMPLGQITGIARAESENALSADARSGHSAPERI